MPSQSRRYKTSLGICALDEGTGEFLANLQKEIDRLK